MADPQQEREVLRRHVLGWSVECDRIDPGGDHGRDLVLAQGATGLDLARVEKLDALTQSLELALTTALGSDIFNTDFGFDGLRALAEETSPTMVRERVRIAVIQVLQKDPRVRRIHDVSLGDDAAPGSRELKVTVAFETASGDDAKATLGGVDGSG
jgi:phage baseplate assembly protein W